MKIAIASGKGGTGKTTLATNLSALLSKSFKTVLCDLDVEEPNSKLFFKEDKLVHQEDKFNMIPQWKEDPCTLCGICQKVCNYNAIIQIDQIIMVFPQLCHSCYACSELCPYEALPMQAYKTGELKHFQNGYLDFVESRLDLGQELAVPLIAQSIEYIDKNFDTYDFKIYDSPPGTSCPVIEATKHADLVILITEPTPFGFHDLKLAIKTMDKLGKKYGIVINRDGIGNKEVENYCNKQNIPILAKIPNSRKVAELYSNGQLLYQEIPEIKTELDKIIEYAMNLRGTLVK